MALTMEQTRLAALKSIGTTGGVQIPPGSEYRYQWYLRECSDEGEVANAKEWRGACKKLREMPKMSDRRKKLLIKKAERSKRFNRAMYNKYCEEIREGNRDKRNTINWLMKESNKARSNGFEELASSIRDVLKNIP